LASKIVFAEESGVPRFQSLTMRGYPEVVMDPGPKSVPTQTVSWSSHERLDLASGRAKPPGTNSFVFVSNSRITFASEPPIDSSIVHRLYAGGRQSALSQTQDLPSVFASASTSSTVSHCGLAVR
jgi:hypothetical protein